LGETGGQIGNVTGNQGRFRVLEAECLVRQFAIEYFCESTPEWIAHVEKHEGRRGFSSHQFWHGLRVAMNSDVVIG
jgi:hypothetical protein